MTTLRFRSSMHHEKPMSWITYAILYHNDVILMYWYGDYNCCEWLANYVYFLFWETLCFSYYIVEFSAKIYELCIMIINFSSICIHEHMTYDVIMIPYDFGQPLNRFKGNKSVWESGKINLTITYKNKLGPEKQTIT